MKIDLSDLNESYHASESGYAGALPTGLYKARLINAEVTSSKNQNPQVKWILEAETSNGELGTTMKFSPLLPQSMRFLRVDLETLGFVLGHINDLHVILPGLVGTMIEIEVQDNISTGLHRVDFIRKI